jgi:hypothetical protein
VTIRVDGKIVASGRRQIVASINDGVDNVQPNFKTAAEHEGSADHDIDFGGQDNDHGEESEEEKEKTRKLALPKKTKIASVVDPNVLREIALRDIEERDQTETGDGGDSDEEGLEIDFHSKTVRPRVKLRVPNEESDTDNFDVEWIDDSIGEACWHMRALGAQIPGSLDGWMPPKELDSWGGYVPMIGSGAPLLDEIDNPGGWNLYSFTPKYENGKYISHQTQEGEIVVPKDSDAERVVGNWKFHYNRWWPSKFDRKTYVRGSAKN